MPNIAYAVYVSIRIKIVLVVLPILLVTVMLVGMTSYFSATSGINGIAREFLGFKSDSLEKYADSQWSLLLENGLADKPEFVEAVKNAINLYGKSIVLSPTELIFALASDGSIAQATTETKAESSEGNAVIALLKENKSNMFTFKLAGVERVGKGFAFPALDWYFVVSESTDAFFSAASTIRNQTIIILSISMVLASILLYIFSRTLTNPIRTIVDTMKDIISSGDLSKIVPVLYNDETGTLAHTFNIMTNELDKAWKQIKNYALQAVLAQKSEQRLKNVFQRYVPQEIIDSVVSRPAQALIGEEQTLAILFSDIRGFTTISESLSPSDLVTSLNQYFSYMVDTIVSRQGIVDKYIGDAIMAFWGAPVKHTDDPFRAIKAGIEMVKQIKAFNDSQIAKGKPEFKTGIGINYGVVTVGNIGTDKKMDYTVIGDNVNLASRLEGLTKEYHADIIISEFLQKEIADTFPTRLLDAVAVKGKKIGVRIYSVSEGLDQNIAEGWNVHNQAMHEYFDHKFDKALVLFAKAGKLMPGDHMVGVMTQRCEEYQHNPPPADWDGVEIKKTK